MCMCVHVYACLAQATAVPISGDPRLGQLQNFHQDRGGDWDRCQERRVRLCEKSCYLEAATGLLAARRAALETDHNGDDGLGEDLQRPITQKNHVQPNQSHVEFALEWVANLLQLTRAVTQ